MYGIFAYIILHLPYMDSMGTPLVNDVPTTCEKAKQKSSTQTCQIKKERYMILVKCWELYTKAPRGVN